MLGFDDILHHIQRAYLPRLLTLHEEMAGFNGRLADSLGAHFHRIVPPSVRILHPLDRMWFRLWISQRVRPSSSICRLLILTLARWFIAASASVVGSTVSFILSRSVLKNMVHRLVAHDKRFAALALTLKHDGIKLLVMIRLCPLPYSLSNGAIATFPTVHWASYAAATAIISPKLMLHVFVGSQLEKIAEGGGKMDAKTKAISYVSIVIGLIAGVATGWIMYRKTTERAAQLEAEERAGVRRASIEDLERQYADDPDALEAAETLREEEDDISLRTGWGDDEYHDDPPELDDDLEISNDPFKAGDGDEEEETTGRR